MQKHNFISILLTDIVTFCPHFFDVFPRILINPNFGDRLHAL